MQFLRVYLDRISEDYEDNIEDLIATSDLKRQQAKNSLKNARRRAARRKNSPFKNSKSKKKKKKAPKYNVQVQVIDIDEQLDAEGEGDMDAEIVIEDTVQEKLPDENDPESSFDQPDHEKSLDDGETVIKNEHESSVDEKDHDKSIDHDQSVDEKDHDKSIDHDQSVDENDHDQSVDEKDPDQSIDENDQEKSNDENNEENNHSNKQIVKPPFVDETTEDLLDDLKSKVDDLEDLDLDGEGEGEGDDDSLDNIPTEDLLKSKDDTSDPFDKLL